MEEVRGVQIKIKDTTFLKNNTYKNEKQLEKEIHDNINDFIESYYGDEVVESSTNKNCLANNNKQIKGKRVDIYVKGKKCEYIIECKNSKYSYENIQAIGQLLNYGRYFKRAKLMLVTTLFDIDTARTIQQYNLPIRIVMVYGDKLLEYGGEEPWQQ
jgi:hypothetical protein